MTGNRRRSVLGVIGCGQMAYALMRGCGLAEESVFTRLLACDVDQERIDLFARDFGADFCAVEDMAARADVLLLAVKPQHFEAVLGRLSHISPDQLVVSVAAGISTQRIETWLGEPVPVVRTMPNIAALARRSVTAICAGRHAGAAEVEWVRRLMSCSGETFVYPESYMDAVGAISGAGPAYACLVLEAFADAAVMLGIARQDAEKMVLATVRGTLDLLAQEEMTPVTLKQKVCSPGGTTIRALRQLEARGLRAGFFEAAQAAYDRSVELSGR